MLFKQTSDSHVLQPATVMVELGAGAGVSRNQTQTSRTKRNDEGNICTKLPEVWQQLTGHIDEKTGSVALKAKRKLRGGRRTGKGATLNRRQLEAARFICASEITLGAKPHSHRQQRSIYEL